MNSFGISWLIKVAGFAVMLAASCGTARASVYDFSYHFLDGGSSAGTITGSFSGTGSLNSITNISNISASLDGNPIAGPLFAWSYTPSSSNCGDPSCFTLGGAIVSNTGGSNFVFSTASTNAELAGSTYFYIIQPWANPPAQTVAAQFAFGTNPQTYIDHYNGQFVPENFTVSAAVPEPSTWAMMILGFAGVGFLAYRRKRNSIAVA